MLTDCFYRFLTSAKQYDSFLEYYKQEDAELIVRELNGKDLLGHRVALSSYVGSLLQGRFAAHNTYVGS